MLRFFVELRIPLNVCFKHVFLFCELSMGLCVLFLVNQHEILVFLEIADVELYIVVQQTCCVLYVHK